MVGEVIFREDQNLTELIGGLQSYSKELVPLSQPKTPTTEGFLGWISCPSSLAFHRAEESKVTELMKN